MIDKQLIKFIINESDLMNEDIVLEIGHGKGALTKELVKYSAVIGVDIDENLFDVKSNNRLKLLKGNILENIEDIKQKYNFNKIISNIPYNISEPLFKKLFKIDFELCILTIGKDFADILTEKKSKNRIGIIANELYEIKLLKTVKPDSFFPKPRVDSAVISIRPKKKESIYKQIVLLDDKKLKNALISIIKDKTKNELKQKLQSKLFEKKLYELSNQEFVEFDNLIRKI